MCLLHLAILYTPRPKVQDRRQWCIATGEIVQEFRRGGAWCTRPPYRELRRDILAFVHGLALNLGGIGVVNDVVSDGVGQSKIVQVFMPLAGVVLEAEDNGGCST